MDRGQLLRRIDRAWSALIGSYAGLSHAQLMTPGVTEAWSVRDILAHVTTWEEEALEHLPAILAGRTPPRYSTTYGGIDAFNARKTAQKAPLSLADVVQQLEATHRRLIKLVQSAPAAALCGETRFRRRLRLDTYGHYPQHAAAIRAWREHQGLEAPPQLGEQLALTEPPRLGERQGLAGSPRLGEPPRMGGPSTRPANAALRKSAVRRARRGSPRALRPATRPPRRRWPETSRPQPA